MLQYEWYSMFHVVWPSGVIVLAFDLRLNGRGQLQIADELFVNKQHNLVLVAGQLHLMVGKVTIGRFVRSFSSGAAVDCWQSFDVPFSLPPALRPRHGPVRNSPLTLRLVLYIYRA